MILAKSFALFFPFWIACAPAPGAPIVCHGGMLWDMPFLALKACERALPRIEGEHRVQVPPHAGFGCAEADEGAFAAQVRGA